MLITMSFIRIKNNLNYQKTLISTATVPLTHVLILDASTINTRAEIIDCFQLVMQKKKFFLHYTFFIYFFQFFNLLKR